MYDYPLYNPMINPYMAPQNQITQQPRKEVVKVNGENGARAFPMGANSSALLLDESGVIVWLVTTDGAGYKTVAPFDISPHQAAPTPDFNSLEARITKLEERLYAANNFADAQRSKPRTNQANYQYTPQHEQSSDSYAAAYTVEKSTDATSD